MGGCMNSRTCKRPSVRLLVVDDHDLIREGLRAIVRGTEIEIVAEAGDGESALRMTLEHEIDVVLLDIRIPDGNGFDVLSQIKREKPSLPVLIHTVHEKPHYAARALALGAAGYLVKGNGSSELLTAIRGACDSGNANPGLLQAADRCV